MITTFFHNHIDTTADRHCEAITFEHFLRFVRQVIYVLLYSSHMTDIKHAC
jgi:hypothetical protein